MCTLSYFFSCFSRGVAEKPPLCLPLHPQRERSAEDCRAVTLSDIDGELAVVTIRQLVFSNFAERLQGFAPGRLERGQFDSEIVYGHVAGIGHVEKETRHQAIVAGFKACGF